MGLPIDLFIDPPDPNLLCPICRDVLDDPSSLQCGHLFCKSCLLSYQENTQQQQLSTINGNGNTPGGGGGDVCSNSSRRRYNFKGVSIVCPTCRHLAVIGNEANTSGGGSWSHTSNPIVKSIIENMQVVCRNQFEREEEVRELEKSRGHSRGGGGEGVHHGMHNINNDHHAATTTATMDDSPIIECCGWKGRLCDYKSHVDTTCQLQLVTCQSSECNERLERGRMRSGGYCKKTECAISIARKFSAERRADLMVLQKETMFLKREVATLNKNGSSDKENTNWRFNNASSMEYSTGAGANVEAVVGGESLLTQKAAMLCSQADRILSKGIEADSNSNHQNSEQGLSPEMSPLARPSFGVRKIIHDKSLMSPRPWVVKAASGNSSGKALTDGSSCMKENKDVNAKFLGTNNEEADHSTPTKKDIPHGLDLIKTTNGQLPSDENDENNNAFIMAAVKILVEKEMTKLIQQQKNTDALLPVKKHAITKKEGMPPLSHDSMRVMFVHRHLMDFCRSWMRSKPEALHDFVVYRPKISVGEQSCCSSSNSTSSINRLLCGIPGPKRTGWDGGLFPILMEWNNVDMPPTCRFPRDFHHANVLPSGLVSLSTLTEGWHPEISIVELLFDLQQLLAHPNHDKPAQTDARESYRNGTYDYKSMIQTSLYAPTSLLEMAFQIDGFAADDDDDTSSWQLVDGAVLSGQSLNAMHNPVVSPRPVEPRFAMSTRTNNGRRTCCRLHCSCCAWGQTLWDSKREMRYLFGKGGGS